MNLNEMGIRAKAASRKLALLNQSEKNNILLAIKKAILESEEEILAANAEDVKAAGKLRTPSFIDRMTLTSKRLKEIADGIDSLIPLNDPVNVELSRIERQNGLIIRKVSVPLGVIGIIYESRPNVTIDCAVLCLKAGNAVILRGSKDTLNSNLVLTACMQRALAELNLPEDAVQLVEDASHETAEELMRLSYLDVLIPRGSARLIQTVLENAKVPVIETGAGNCHVYVDEGADWNEAIEIIVNAKTSRVSVCNACESVLIHEKERGILADLAAALHTHQVEMTGCPISQKESPWIKPATEEDYGTEYLDYKLSIKIVSDIEEAINHINHYSTHHSETIMTKDKKRAEKFQKEVDSACVYVNASTRFSDGFEFGFGAEIGISTQKLHARGPMGLEALTSYKYMIDGQGQIR